ncbi:hypothetical protein AN1V17_39840 [Vallitalea sediminicola]
MKNHRLIYFIIVNLILIFVVNGCAQFNPPSPINTTAINKTDITKNTNVIEQEYTNFSSNDSSIKSIKESIQKDDNIDDNFSNYIKQIDNPSKTIDYTCIADNLIKSYKYYSPKYTTYIRCDIYYIQMVCYIKKLYIGDSTEPFYINEYSQDSTLSDDIKDSAIWINETNILVDGLYLYKIPTQTFNEFTSLCNQLVPNQLLDYTINNCRTHIAYLTNDKIYLFDIYNNDIRTISKESHLTDYQNEHRILWDEKNQIYFDTYYEIFLDNRNKTKNKIFKFNLETDMLELLYDDTYALGPSSYDNRYGTIYNYNALNTDGHHCLVKILDNKTNSIIFEFLGTHFSWSNNSYEILFSYNTSTKHLKINFTGECDVSDFNCNNQPNKYNY